MRSYEIKPIRKRGDKKPRGYRLLLLMGVTVCETVETFLYLTADDLGREWIAAEQ